MKYYLIKLTSINIGIYTLNLILTSIFSIQVALHLMGFITIIIFFDAVIAQNDLKILEIKYNNLLRYNDVQKDLNIIKTKLDLLTSEINIHLLDTKSEFSKNEIDIDININKNNNNDFNYDLARKALTKSKSLSFKKINKNNDEIPIINIGEVITLSVKK